MYKIGPLVDGAVPVVMSNRSLTQNDYENLQLRLPLTGWVSGDFLPTSYVPLSATSAQELPNGNWLITNNYSGDDQYKNWLAGIPAVDDSSSDVSSFGGEIFELQWPTGTTPEQIIWTSPQLVRTTRPGITPGVWVQQSQQTYSLQQPASAVRQ